MDNKDGLLDIQRSQKKLEGRKLDDAIITLIFNHYGIEMHKIGKNRGSWERPMFNIRRSTAKKESKKKGWQESNRRWRKAPT